MGSFSSLADLKAIETAEPWEAAGRPRSIHEMLDQAKRAHGQRPAISFQLLSDPGARALTLTWAELLHRSTQAANLFRRLGIGPKDVVAYVLPNCLETAVTFLGGAMAGIVNPINPLLEPEQVGAILRETGAKVVVTLRAFPKTDLPQRVAKAVALAPAVTTVLEVDLAPYLGFPKSVIAGLLRPKFTPAHQARILNFTKECAGEKGDALAFPDVTDDRVAAYFHTGGTTGMPKVAQHKVSGMVYNGWLGARLLFQPQDVVLCPLPLFHVFAVHPILMSMITSGAHVVFPTPAGYRGEGVFDNLWKLIERWKVTYLVTVPTALSALMQRPVNADISTLRGAFSGSAPLPLELFRRFETATGVQIVEGYGLTEATCLVSVNPPDGNKKIGSVGFPFPHTQVRILTTDGSGGWRDCAADEVGEICVFNPGVLAGNTYTEAEKNRALYADDRYLRTGDLGRIDTEGYLFITGRAKDLIIRGGHNIDPAVIEEALMGHAAVAMVGAIGQPDAHAGELPCAYVELVKGTSVDIAELHSHAQNAISERAALPKHIEILPELPKTAVGKVFKPDLRRLAVKRIFDASLAEAGQPAMVRDVIEDKKRGLVARIETSGQVDREKVASILGQFAMAWEWAE